MNKPGFPFGRAARLPTLPTFRTHPLEIRPHRLSPRLKLFAAIALAACVLQSPVWMPHGLPLGDLTVAYLCEHIYQARWMAEGEVPLWNPHSFFGSPGVATLQYGSFYLPNLFLNWILSPVAAMKANFLLHLWVAGWFMALFAGRLGAKATGQFASAVFYMGCGHLISKLGHVSHWQAACLFPGLLWSIEWWLQSRRLGAFAAVTAIFGNMILAGYLHVSVMAGAGVAIYLAAYWIAGRGTKRFAGAVMLAPAFLWGVAMAALPLLLTINFLPHTERAALTFDDFSSYSLSFGETLLYLMPLIRGTDWWTFGGYNGSWNLTESNGWIGCAALVLAMVGTMTGFRCRRRHAVLGLALIAVFSFIASLGAETPLSKLLFHVPVVKMFRGQGRWVFLFDVSMASLAGLGLHRLGVVLAAGVPRFVRVIRASVAISALLAIVVTGLMILFAVCARRDPDPEWLSKLCNPSLVELWPTWMPVAGANVTLAAILAARRWRKPALLLVILASFVAESTVTSRYLMPPFETKTVFDPDLHPATRAMQERAGDLEGYRFYPVRIAPAHNDFLTMVPSTHAPLRARSFAGYGPLYPFDMRVLFGMGSTGMINNIDFMLADNRILSMMNLRFFTLPPSHESIQKPQHLLETAPAPWQQRLGDNAPAYVRVPLDNAGVQLFENRFALPSAWTVERVFSISEVSNPVEALVEVCRWLFDSNTLFDPRIEAVHVGPLPKELSQTFISASVKSSYDGPNVIKAKLKLPKDQKGPVFVVFAEQYIDGWQASIEGEPAKLYRVNALECGVLVPEGKKRIRLEYRPKGLTPGTAISISAVLAWMGMVGGSLFTQIAKHRFLLRHRTKYQ